MGLASGCWLFSSLDMTATFFNDALTCISDSGLICVVQDSGCIHPPFGDGSPEYSIFSLYFGQTLTFLVTNANFIDFRESSTSNARAADPLSNLASKPSDTGESISLFTVFVCDIYQSHLWASARTILSSVAYCSPLTTWTNQWIRRLVLEFWRPCTQIANSDSQS